MIFCLFFAGDILYRDHILNSVDTNLFGIEALDIKLKMEITSHQKTSLELKCLKTWSDYYTWRALEFDWPCAVLMHWTLTVYHILTNLMLELCK